MARAWPTLRAPGMTVETPGCCHAQAMATWAGVTSSPESATERGELARRVEAGCVVDAGEGLAHVEGAAVAVVGAVVVGARRSCPCRYLPERRPEASGTRAMMPTPAAAAAGSTSLERLHPEGVEDDLDARDVGPGDRAERLVDRLDADAVGRDDLILDEPVQDVVRRVVVDDLARRAVQLHQFDPLHAEVAPGPVEPGPEVRLHVVGRHLLRTASHLGRDREARVRVRRDELPDEPLAAPVAVHISSVEERDARPAPTRPVRRVRRPR